MGRLFFRAACDNKEFDIVAGNELKGDAAGSAHLLKWEKEKIYQCPVSRRK